MIRIGIIGINYGRTVQLPAFRADLRCEVVALCSSHEARARQAADDVGVAKSFGDWRALVADKNVDAVSIATQPSLQAEIAVAALQAGKPVFAEKPLAGDLSAARTMLDAADHSGLPTGIDFNFTQIAAWLRAKEMLDQGAIGRLNNVRVHWHFENQSSRMHLRNWKTIGAAEGGGVLGNFVSHCFHYLEWFVGPVAGLQARIAGLPDDPEIQTTVAVTLQYEQGPMVSLSMSCASYRGPGHRIEFLGEEGAIVLDNPTTDYMRGFELTYSKFAGEFERILTEDPTDTLYLDGRVAPVSRLVNQFVDAIDDAPHYKLNTAPGFAAGYRVQFLIDAAQRSHREGRWIDVATEVKASKEK